MVCCLFSSANSFLEALLPLVEDGILLLEAGMDHPSKFLVIDKTMNGILDAVQGDYTKAGSEAWNGSKGMLGLEPSVAV